MISICLVCEQPLPPGEQEAYEAVFALPDAAGHTPETLGVVCVLCSVAEEDEFARHHGDDMEHIHLRFDGELN